MSLVLVKRSFGEMSYTLETCSMGCEDSYVGKRVAMYEALILGRTCAWLCPKCATAWAGMWVQAGGGEPVRRRRRVESQKAVAA